MFIQVLIGEMKFQHARLIMQQLFEITEAHGKAIFHGQDMFDIQAILDPQVAVQEWLIFFDHTLDHRAQQAGVVLRRDAQAPGL